MKRSHEPEDEAFPRGSGFAPAPRAKRRATPLPRRGPAAASESPKSGAAGGQKRPRGRTFVEQLKAKARCSAAARRRASPAAFAAQSLSPGVRLWGVVLEARQRSVVIALPSGLRGSARAADCSDVHFAWLQAGRELGAAGAGVGALAPGQPPALAATFAPGQRVRCTLHAVGPGAGGRTKLSLSLRCSALLAGCDAPQLLRPGRLLPWAVASVEDHGYALTQGPGGPAGKAGGFVAAADAPPGLLPGAPLEAVLLSPPSARHPARVTAEAGRVASAAPLGGGGCDGGGGGDPAPGVSFSSLLPGDAVAVSVSASLPDGLAVTACGLFEGVVDWLQLPGLFPGAGALGPGLDPGSAHTARVLLSDPASKRLVLTLAPQHVCLAPLGPGPRVGARLEGLTVARVDPSLGLLLRLPGPGAVGGYAHLSQLADGAVDPALGGYAAGQAVPRAAVVGWRPLDRLLALSLRPSALAAPFLTAADAPPGLRVEATVVSCGARGASLSLACGLRAWAPLAHCSDAATPRAAARLAAGARVAARVWGVSPAGRLLLTLKPSLVAARLPPLTARDPAPGTAAHGVLTGAGPGGVFVAFYGGVCGRAPPGQAPAGANLGATVRVTVVAATPQGLTLAMGGAAAAAAAAKEEAGVPSGGGGAVAAPPSPAPPLAVWPVATVVGPLPPPARGLALRLPDGAAVSVAAAQLGETAAASEAALRRLRPGAALGPLVALDGRGAVSAKRSLVEAAADGRLPAAFESLPPVGAPVVGFASGASPAGLFVRFAGGFTALLPARRLAGATGQPAVGDTVCAVVDATDPTTRRATLRPDGAPHAHALRDAVVASGWFGRAAGGGGAGALPGSLLRLLVRSPGPTALCDVVGESDAVALCGGCADAVQGDSLDAVLLWSDTTAGGGDDDGLRHCSARPGLVARVRARAAAVAAAPTPAAPPAAAPPPGPLSCIVEARLGWAVVVSLPPGADGDATRARKGGGAPPPPLLALLPAACLPPTPAPCDPEVGASLPCVAAYAEPQQGLGGWLLLLAAPNDAAGGDEVVADARLAARRAPRGAGCVERATVVACEPERLTVALAGGGTAILHATRLPPVDTADAAARDVPTAAYPPGTQLAVRVWRDAPGGSRPAAGAGEAAPDAADAAAAAAAHDRQPRARPAFGRPPSRASLSSLRPGDVVTCAVALGADAAGRHWVALSPTARARLALPHQMVANGDGGATLPQALAPGTRLAVSVVTADAATRRFVVAALPPGASGAAGGGDGGDGGGGGEGAAAAPAAVAAAAAPARPAVGSLVDGCVVRSTPLSLVLSLPGWPPGGRLCATQSGDSLLPHPCAPRFGPGHPLRGLVVLGTNRAGEAVLSARASRGAAPQPALPPLPAGHDGADAPAPLPFPEVASAAALSPGQRVCGLVASSGRAGVFVRLGPRTTGRVLLGRLGAAFVPDVASAFPPGARVAASVLTCDGDAGRVELTLRDADAPRPGRAPPGPHPALATLAVGALRRGTVTRVESYGAFVRLLAPVDGDGDAPGEPHAGPPLVGLVHVSNWAAPARAGPQQPAKGGKGRGAAAAHAALSTARPGDAVSVVVTEVDAARGRLSLAVARGAAARPPGGADAAGDAAAVAAAGGVPSAPPGEPLADAADDEEEAEEGDAAAGRAPGGGGALLWDEPEAEAAEGEAAGAAPPSPAAVAVSAAAAARAVRRAAAAAGSGDAPGFGGHAPAAGAADASALRCAVVASPTDGGLRVHLMASLAAGGDAEGARFAARAALGLGPAGDAAAVPSDCEEARAAVWVAWMNLEAGPLAGGAEPDRQRCVAEVFALAVQRADAKAMHAARVGVAQRAGWHAEAVAAAAAATRRFRASCGAWVRLVGLHTGGPRPDPVAARSALDRAVASLPVRKHGKLLVAVGLQAFRAGDPAWGRAQLEALLAAHPQRWDVWGALADAEARAGAQPGGGGGDRMRAVYRRALAQPPPSRAARGLLKRWLAAEKQAGDAAGLEAVRATAAVLLQAQYQ